MSTDYENTRRRQVRKGLLATYLREKIKEVTEKRIYYEDDGEYKKSARNTDKLKEGALIEMRVCDFLDHTALATAQDEVLDMVKIIFWEVSFETFKPFGYCESWKKSEEEMHGQMLFSKPRLDVVDEEIELRGRYEKSASGEIYGGSERPRKYIDNFLNKARELLDIRIEKGEIGLPEFVVPIKKGRPKGYVFYPPNVDSPKKVQN